ncbi:MAG: carboxypeptidase-like regulatory domain-containing protein [Nitrospiraceae bacterium]|nr:carboxypeptidase-like regulatory domain-containing protein [Nitrospiraceae bacterium]
MKKIFVALSVLALGVVLFAGMAMANGTLTATLLYKDSGGVIHPLDHAYVYLQSGAQLSPRERYFKSAQYIFGPTDSTGYISASVPEGTYHVRITRRAPLTTTPTQAQAYGPPKAGDYTWEYGGPAAATITVTTGSVTNLGPIYAAIFGQQTTISGTVIISGNPMKGAFVVAMTAPCYKSIGSYSWSGTYACKGVNSPAQALTDSNGNYTIKFRNPGTYYVYAMPKPQYWAGSGMPWPTCGSCMDGGKYYSDCNVCLSYETSQSQGWPASNFCMPYCPITVNTGDNVTGQNINNYNNAWSWPSPPYR